MEEWLYLFLWGAILGAVIIGALIVMINKILIPRIYNYKVVLKYLVNGRLKIEDTRAKVVKNRDGIEKLILKGRIFRKLNVPKPTDDVIEITGKGSNFLTGYVVRNKEVVWAENDTDTLEDLKDSKKVKEKMEPLTDSQRMLWMNEQKKSDRDKRLSLGEILQVAAPSIMILMIFILALVFWEDITAPMLDAQETQKQILDSNTKLVAEMNKLAKTFKGIDTLEDDIDLIDIGDTGEEFER